MNWSELIKSQMAMNYNAAEKLMDLVEEDSLGWKPTTGQNWMTTGQLLRHITESCGFCFNGFVTGDWTPPADLITEPGVMLPPAEKLPSVASLAEARDLLAKDKALALKLLEDTGEEALATRLVSAPWDPTPELLGKQLLGMVGHLELHKSQLFYYLKLQGKPVNTMHLFGMV